MNRFVRALMMGAAWVCFAVGCVGIVVPVLPTTPLVLLATFLFAKSSPRCHRWICSSKVYRAYVVPFREAGGMPVAVKARVLVISWAFMAVSALVVQKPTVWAILACCALFMFYLVGFRIPTIDAGSVAPARMAEEAE